MMATSAVKEGERKRNKISVLPSRLFKHAVSGVQKESERFTNKMFEKKFTQEYDARNSSKKISNEDKGENVSNNHVQKHRMPRSYNSNSGDCHMNAVHSCNTEKSHEISENSKINDYNGSSKHSKSSDTYKKECLSSNAVSCKDHIKTSSNYKMSYHQNDDSDIIKQMPKPARLHNNPNDSSKHHQNDDSDIIKRMPKPARLHNNPNDSSKHIVNAKFDFHNEKKLNSNLISDSHINSSPKSFDKRNSNFAQFSYHQGEVHHTYSKPKMYSYPSQQYDSHKVSFNRSPPKCSNSNQYVKPKESNPNYMLDHITKIDHTQEDSFSDSNLDLENDSEDNNPETKHQRFCLELDENLIIVKGNLHNSSNTMKMKNIQITCKTVPDSVTNSSAISNFSSVPSVSNALVSPTSIALTPSVSSTPISPISNVSSLFPVQTTSSESMISDFSPALTVETSPSLTLFDSFDDKSLINDNGKLVCSNDDIIPPPVDPVSASNNSSSSCENNRTLLRNGESGSIEGLYEDETYCLLPESAHIEAISNFIFKTVKKRSVPFTVADKVVNDLQRLFKNHFEGNVIDYYGSYHTDLAITTSDINLVIRADASVRKSFMYEIYKILQNELERYHVLPYDEGTNTYRSKINFTHPDTGVNCELTYLGRSREDKYFKMGKFLKDMCLLDRRVKPLIIVVKVWAEHCNISEVEDGKLHPIGFALSVIHFLQHCENPVLPTCCEKQDIWDMKEDLSGNDLPIGALWLDFLKYYAFTFNWQEDVLTVTSVDKVSKKSKHWDKFWIAIEDPFTEKNIAESVINKDVADHIKTCFRHTYNHFLSGKETNSSSDNDDNQSGSESGSSQLEFSFNDCTIEQNEDICERCEEIDDVCDECKKKIYVQPLASVPKMTDDFLKVIKEALSIVYKKYMLSDEEVEKRRKFVENLQLEVHKIYRDAQMSLFGSSANGFGFKKSDLDICMTFSESKEFKPIVVLKSLRRLLQRNRDFVDVIAIFNAQIPILKFRYKPEGWRGDISLNNVLAVHNSELLYTYSLIDERCKILGCALKLIAKKALIADVTEKALSSYSYLIMVIHFLQQTDPPVLPVLQDIQFRDNYDLKHIVDNCNVWFCKNPDNIKQLFKTENYVPVEQLFLDLLDYYCSFDYDSVITIRQKEVLTLTFCESMRSARLFNIQDPFLVNKNLGCVVSPAKAQETKSIFNRTRMLFRTPKKEPISDLENHFFSSMSLTGRIQKEVLCDCCGKFGHDQNNCKQSSPLRNNFFKYPGKNQYANRNAFFKKNQMTKPSFREKL